MLSVLYFSSLWSLSIGSMIRRNGLVTSKLCCYSFSFLSVLFSEKKVMNLRSAGKKKDKNAKLLATAAVYDIV